MVETIGDSSLITNENLTEKRSLGDKKRSKSKKPKDPTKAKEIEGNKLRKSMKKQKSALPFEPSCLSEKCEGEAAH